ncbi:hypothetical protein CMI47_18705 [Candidatus Pacearchaeota archaeon]|nr:hypothetical protein [Candidatus Pacearchaeota archaeon]|tara:strand:+ start:865 stop:1122 length:258 start_codon:yes stop_codon:yes gene_type:complete
MALKTFNVDDVVYKEFSKHCKKEGISMSKKVEKFIAEEVSRIKGLGKSVREEVEVIEKDTADRSSAVHSAGVSTEGDEHSMGRYC